MLHWWTIGKATGTGVVSGLVAFMIWPFFAAWQEILFWPFVAALALSAFSGASILAISFADMIRHRRGESIRPVRIFDIVIGLALFASGAIELRYLF